MFFYQAVRRVHGDVTHVLSLGVIGHAQAQFIIRVQNRRIPGHLDRNTFQLSQLFKRINASEAKVIRSHVQAGGYVATPVTETGT